MEAFNLKKLTDVAFTEEYQVKVSNRLAAEKNFDDDNDNDDDDISKAWKVLRKYEDFSHRECS
jgi:ribosomal protein L14E/L6E/L27E